MIIQSSAVAAELLEDRAEQDEMVAMFEDFEANTGWKLGKIVLFLKMQWGRQNEREYFRTGEHSFLIAFQCPSLPRRRRRRPHPTQSSRALRLWTR
jgi:hypothetical protein